MEPMMEPKEYIGRRVTIRDSGSAKQYDVDSLTKRGDAVLSFDGVYAGIVELDRLEVLPMDKRYSTGAFERGYRPMSSIAVTNDEALEFFMFTMLQAATLFELVPSPLDPVVHGQVMNDCSRDELKRLLTARGESADGPCVRAALAYYDTATAWYAEDKVKYDE